MERSVSDRTILDGFVEDFCKIVERHVKYLVCSGFVAIAHGRSRGTEDIDMIIDKMSFEDFERMHNDLVSNGFESLQSQEVNEIYSYLEKGDSVRYVRKGEHLPEMEVKFVKDELDQFQLTTRTKLEFTGLEVWFSSVEVNIAFKEELLRSDKDIEDAKHLRVVYEGKINENVVRDVKKMIRRLRLKEDGS